MVDKITAEHMIDVSIPCWNSDKTLEACLRGLQRSDIPIRKIFVIGQCSTDRTCEIARKYGAEIVSHSGRYTDAIILGAETAETEYYINTESDVIVSPHFFTTLKPYYKKNLITKGVVKNYLTKKYSSIAKDWMDSYKKYDRLSGFAIFIAHREPFVDVFRKVIEPWKGIDAGSDTLMHQYCRDNNIPCYQDATLISTHLIMTLQKLWRSQVWYGRSVKHIPRIGSDSCFSFPRTLISLVKHPDINLCLHQLICFSAWWWGWLTG